MKHFVCIILALFLLCSCSNPHEISEVQATVETTIPQEPADPHALRLTQESNVRKETYLGKAAYEAFLAQAETLFIIPGLKQVFTPQGIAISPTTGRTYISAYSVDTIPSVIIVTEAGTNDLVAEYHLYNADGSPLTSHVGGIAVTETHLYVSDKMDSEGSYQIALIPLSELPTSGAHDITVVETIPMAMSPSMMNYSGGYLWVGNFYHPNADYNLSPNMDYTTQAKDGSEYGCYILGFDMSQGHNRLLGTDPYPMPDIILAAPDRIQGITLTNNGSLVLSQSYGRANDSTLLIYQLNFGNAPDLELTLNGQSIPAYLLDDNRLAKSINSIPMSEGLTTTPDGHVLILYESGAIRYEDGKHRTSYVWTMSVE